MSINKQATYMSEYRFNKYNERKAKIFDVLGNKCALCGDENKDVLEVDHIVRESKEFEVLAKCWCKSWDKLLVEVNKCQLLCEKCHALKTVTDRGYQHAKGKHGTVSSYRYCRCELCRAANAKMCREYRAIKLGRPSVQRVSGVIKHGTVVGYEYFKCRCSECKSANSSYRKGLRDARAARLV